jgi:excinuclease ABC subunit A
VIVIEHNLDVIKTADWVIEMGPEGGHKGGTVVGIGTPEEVARIEGSATGDFLRPILAITRPLAGGGEAAVRAGRANGGNGSTGGGARVGNGSRAAKSNGTRAAASEPAPPTAKKAAKAAATKAAPAKRAPAKRTRATAG